MCGRRAVPAGAGRGAGEGALSSLWQVFRIERWLTRHHVLVPAAAIAMLLVAGWSSGWRAVLGNVLVAWAGALLAFYAVLSWGRQVLEDIERDRIRRASPGQRNAALGLLLGKPLLQIFTRLHLLIGATSPGTDKSLATLRARAETLLIASATFEETAGGIGGAVNPDVLGLFEAISSNAKFWRDQGEYLMGHFERYAAVLDTEEREALHNVARRLQLLGDSSVDLHAERESRRVHGRLRTFLDDTIQVAELTVTAMEIYGRHNRPPAN